MGKLKKIFTNTRVIIVLIAIVFALVVINPSFTQKGVAIRSISQNSSASFAGVENPNSNIQPMAREIVLAVNGRAVNTPSEYYDAVSNLSVNKTVKIKTDKQEYTLLPQGKYETEIIEVEEEKVVQVLENVTVNGTTTEELVDKTEIVTVEKEVKTLVDVEGLGIKVFDAPTTNIRKGLDLQGGTRVVLEPEREITPEELEIVKENLKQRLNAFGLSDIIVNDVGDLAGNTFVLVEIPGANEEEVRDLVGNQGMFEAKIGNLTVFTGGDDIKDVCMSAQCSGVESCLPTEGGQYACRFRFSISLSVEAAERQASATGDLGIDFDTSGSRDRYLEKPLDLYLDNQLVDSLNIGEELKGKAVRDVSISGSGAGANEQEALYNSLQNMKRLQTILVTGSLPVKMEIVKVDSISPILGKEFISNAILVALSAIIAVSVIIFLRYRKWQVVVPMVLTLIIETLLVLGLASLIRWNLDIAAIAGIIIAVGTGVDHLIVITDETLKGENSAHHGWKEKIKSAFFIIMAAYFTTVVAMVPLMFAGAGLVKGFAITTFLGVTIGVFIARPAFANVVEILLKN